MRRDLDKPNRFLVPGIPGNAKSYFPNVFLCALDSGYSKVTAMSKLFISHYALKLPTLCMALAKISRVTQHTDSSIPKPCLSATEHLAVSCIQPIKV